MSDDENPSAFLPVLKPKKSLKTPLLDYIRFSEFKRLLGRLSGLIEQEKLNTLAVISEYPLEGKTFFVSAMAMGYASLLNKKVLIINTVTQAHNRSLYLKTVYDEQLGYTPFANPSRQQAQRMIDLVSPLQSDSEEEKAAASTVDFQIGGYVEAIKKRYDLILLDTCALSVSNKNNMDPIVIARQADRSILLTSKASLKRETISSVKERISQWQVRMLGTIHNFGSSP